MTAPSDTAPQSTPADRLAEILSNIAEAAKSAHRAPSAAQLIAVSKTFDVDAIRPVLTAGHRVFGENRVQEAQGKWPVLREAFDGIELHLIGPLQSNKAEDAVRLFDVIHTLDRPKLISSLVKAIDKTGRQPRLLIQVNTGEEPQKAGVLPNDLPRLLEQAKEAGLSVSGLMCIPPVDEEAALHFAFLTKLAKAHELPELSMGMSADYETAVKLGATYVRVGSALFGSRV